MEVILLEKIARLGEMGDVVKVKPGFARNFLLPQEKALPATEENRAFYESRKAELEKRMAEAQSQAESLKVEVEKIQSVSLDRQASETGQLYGSVKARDIADALTQKGLEVPRSQIIIGEPIKAIGEYTVKMALHPQVTAEMQVNINRLSAS